MATNNITCIATTFTFIVVVLTYNATKVTGFKAELIHRDSINSPFYNPTLSRQDIVLRAIARSVNRSKLVTPNGPTSDVFAKEGEYLMKIRLGTPAIDVIGIADTGSDIVWTQSATCTECVEKRNPLYDPRASSSYGQVLCGPFDPPCPHGFMCGYDEYCHYQVHYADGAYSKGTFSIEHMSMDSKDTRNPRIKIELFRFGCGERQGGPYGSEGSGIFGLGPGKYSLVNQLGSHSKQKFAYCLAPLALYGGVSRIHFGDDADVTGTGTITLPLESDDHHYYATLNGFTIGSTRVDFTNVYGRVRPGKILIDSGASIVHLPKPYLEKIRSALVHELGEPLEYDPLHILELCFDTSGGKYKRLPNIVAHFKGGDVTLKSYNVFHTMGPTSCLMFSGDDQMSIYGAIAQTNFIVGFDYNEEVAYIKPQQCLFYGKS